MGHSVSSHTEWIHWASCPLRTAETQTPIHEEMAAESARPSGVSRLPASETQNWALTSHSTNPSSRVTAGKPHRRRRRSVLSIPHASQDSLTRTSEAPGIQAKMDKCEHIKIKSFCSSNHTLREEQTSHRGVGSLCNTYSPISYSCHNPLAKL